MKLIFEVEVESDQEPPVPGERFDVVNDRLHWLDAQFVRVEDDSAEDAR